MEAQKIGCQHNAAHQQNPDGKADAAFLSAVPGQLQAPVRTDMYTVFLRVRRDDLGGVNLFPFDTQQLVGGDAEDFRQLRQRADVRAGLVGLP